MKSNGTKRFLALLLAFAMIATSGIMTSGFALFANESDNTADTQVVQDVDVEEADVTEAEEPAVEEPAEASDETAEAAAEQTDETAEAAEETAEATGETAEAKAVDADEAETVSMPAQSFSEDTGKVTVDVTAAEGAFPEGTKMQLGQLTDEDALAEAEKTVAEGEKVVSAVAVNITFKNENEEEIEPAGDGLVTVVITPDEKLEGDSFSVSHIEDNGEAENIEATEVNEEGATFDADAFSIYVVSGTESVTRTVKFYESKNAMDNGEDPIDTQVVENGDTLTEPEVPDVGDGTTKKFEGWSADGENVYDISAKVEGLTEDEEVSLYPIYTLVNQQEVIYWDYSEEQTTDKSMIIWTDTASAGDYKPVEGKADEVNLHYPNSQACIGWTTSFDDSVASSNGDTSVEPMETITIEDSDVNLYPVVRNANWIIFEENGGTYVEPQYVLTGAKSVKPEDPTKEGYKFEGWYKTMTTDEETGEVTFSDPFTFGETMDETVTLYAKWDAQNTTYTVLIWMEELVNGEYVEGNYSSEYHNSAGYEILSGTTIDSDALPEEVTNLNDSTKDYYDEDLKFYHFGHSDTKEAAGDGSTIINVYYDLNSYTLIFTGYRYNTLTMDGTSYANPSGNPDPFMTDKVSYKIALAAKDDDAYKFTVHFGEWMQDKWPIDGNLSHESSAIRKSDGGTLNLGDRVLIGWSGSTGTYMIEQTMLIESIWDNAFNSDSSLYADGSELVFRGGWKQRKLTVPHTTVTMVQNLDSTDADDKSQYSQFGDPVENVYQDSSSGTLGSSIPGFTFRGMEYNDEEYLGQLKYVLTWNPDIKVTITNPDGTTTTKTGMYVNRVATAKEIVAYQTEQTEPQLVYATKGDNKVNNIVNVTNVSGSSRSLNLYDENSDLKSSVVGTYEDWNRAVNDATTDIGDTAYVVKDAITKSVLYYTRNSYKIDFYNRLGYTTEEGYTEDATEKQLIKTTGETVLYEESLENYYFEPTTKRANVTFEGWYTSENFDEGTEFTEADFASGKMPAGNMILYAKWSDSTIDITFDSENGEEAQGFTIFPGDKVSMLENPEKDGYTFLGWFYKDDDGNYTTPYSFETKLYADTKIYAKWRFDGDIKLKYDLGDGKWSGSNDDVDDDNIEKEMVYKDGETARATKVKTKADDSKKVFLGWKINGEGEIIRPNALFNISTDDVEYKSGSDYGTVTLVAVYGPKTEGASLLFDANGGEDDYTKDLANKEKYELTDAEGLEMSRTGYEFTGWNSKANGNGTSYSKGQTIQVTGKDNVLYAQWKAVEYKATVKYNDENGKEIRDADTYTYKYEDDGIRIQIPQVDGYTPTTVTVNGKTIKVDSSTGTVKILDTMPPYDLEVTVQYSKNQTTPTTTEEDNPTTTTTTTTTTTPAAAGGGGGAAAAPAAAPAFVPAAAAPTAVAVQADDDGNVELAQVEDIETPAALLEDEHLCNLIPFLFMAIAMVVEAFNNKNSKTHKKRMEDLLG